jgi:hypothetical protein
MSKADEIHDIVQKERENISDEDFLRMCFSKKDWYKGLNKNEIIRLNYLKYIPVFSKMLDEFPDDDDGCPRILADAGPVICRAGWGLFLVVLIAKGVSTF